MKNNTTKPRKTSSVVAPVDKQIARFVHNAVKNEQRMHKPRMYVDVSANSVSAITTIAFVDLTPIPQGIAQSDRIGDSVDIESIEVHVQMYYSFSGSAFLQDFFDTLRVGIVQWKMDSSVVAISPTGVFQNPGSFPMITPWNFELSQTYHFIDDRNYYVKGFSDSTVTGAIPTSDSILEWKRTYPINRRVQYHIATSGGTGKFYFFYGSDSASAPHPLINYYIRVHYRQTAD